jgi:hypothetical protein
VFKLNMRKTVKKIAALLAGATMVGATIMGAAALDLSNYPQPFVTNGVFSGKIVVGSAAKTSDVAGAIDLAASLQAAAKTVTAVNVPGAAGTASITGDNFEFRTASDILGFDGSYLGDVRTTLLETDLKALKSGVLSTSRGRTPVKQYLKFEDAAGGKLVFEEDNTGTADVLADFLKFTQDETIFEYQMDFPEGAESDLDDSDYLEDLEGKAINILGAPYTIVQASKDGKSLSLDMLGGQVADTLKDGETKTYDIGGKPYEVTAVFIADDNTAKLSVNNMLTDKLASGETDVLGDGEITVGVQDVLTNQREGIVEFYLGAEKLEMTDSDFTDSDYDTSCAVTIGEEDINDCNVDITASNTTTRVTLNHIYYKLIADDDYYVAAGKGLKAKLQQPEGMLGANWDIMYTGLMKTGTTAIVFKAKGDKAYELEFTNNRGQKYSFPLINNDNDVFAWGDTSGNHILWTEPGASTDPLADNLTYIAKRDYFIVSDKTANDNEKAVTTVLRYKGISTASKQITVEEVGVGDSDYDYAGTDGTDATGKMNIAGKDHDFWVDTDGDYIAVDLDGTGELENLATVNLAVKGEGYVVMPAQAFTAADPVTELNDVLAASKTFTLTTPKEKFDDVPVADEETAVVISNSTNEEVHLTTAAVTADPNADDWEYGLTTYGTYLKFYNPSSTSESETLTIDYPLSMRGGQVFVTAGTVEVNEAAGTEGGSVTTTTLNPIGVGLAVLDTDVESQLGTTKMIVVGGPCVNTIARKLMGITDPAADCTAGFSMGKAIIKLYADKNALLVAGYSAQDTVGACYVLAQYKDYASSLKGTEVQVVAADLKNIVVNSIS